MSPRLIRWWLPALLIVGLLLWRCGKSAQTYASLDLQNAYVGKEACQPCHQQLYESYLSTGMGKSLYRPSSSNIIETFGPEVQVYDSVGDFHYHPYWFGDTMYVREFRLAGKDTTYVRNERVDYVVGSGHQTRSYLIKRNEYLFEVPITWYVERELWDLSPGYEQNNSRFDREIGLTCMGCHTGHVDYIPYSKNRYRKISEGIDCEKCHGPGHAHIQAIEGGQLIDVGVETDYTIVNPAKLPIDKQFDVCQQCHLQGEPVMQAPFTHVVDFRPAMDLAQVADIFVEVPADPAAFGIASHAQRLKQSACFIQSNGNLTCTTCHDPHQGISQTKQTHYTQICQSCHQAANQKACLVSSELRHQAANNCVACHMPKRGTLDIPHVQFHDHYIRGLTAQDSIDVAGIQQFVDLYAATGSEVDSTHLGQAWLQYYESHEPNPAFLMKASKLLQEANPEVIARLALAQGDYNRAAQQIELALQTNADPNWRFLLGEIQEADRAFTAAQQTFIQLYQAYPAMWEAGFRAVTNGLKANVGRRDKLHQLLTQLQHLQTEKPFDIRVWTNMGFIALNLGRYAEAQRYLEHALQIDPDHLTSLKNLIYCLLAQQRKQQAQLIFAHLENKHPTYQGLQALKGQISQIAN